MHFFKVLALIAMAGSVSAGVVKRQGLDDSSSVESAHTESSNRHGGDDDRGRDGSLSSDDHPHTESHRGQDDSTFSLTSTALTATSAALSGQVTPAPATSTEDRGRSGSSDDNSHTEDRDRSASSDDRNRGQDDSTSIASSTALGSPSAVPAGQTSLSPALATAPANNINGAIMSAASVTSVVSMVVIVSSFMTAGFGL